MTTNEEVYHHIRRVALAHGWVTPEQDNASMWEIAVVLWLGEHREGHVTVGTLPDPDAVREALSECDQLALYGPKRIPIQQIAWAALEYEHVRKQYIQEYKHHKYLTRPALEAIAQENEVPFDEKIPDEDLLGAVVEKLVPLQRITRECQSLADRQRWPGSHAGYTRRNKQLRNVSCQKRETSNHSSSLLICNKSTRPKRRKRETMESIGKQYLKLHGSLVVVRELEGPPLLEAHGLLSKEISSEYIWEVCEELASALTKIAEVRGETFPWPINDLEASLKRLCERFKKSTATSTGITKLNMQADIVCLVAQILLQKYKPGDDLRFPWMGFLNCVRPSDQLVSILAARAKVAFLVSHPELAVLPNDTGFSAFGPMHRVGLAIREAIQRGVYK